jgi:hypothetical protein
LAEKQWALQYYKQDHEWGKVKRENVESGVGEAYEDIR